MLSRMTRVRFCGKMARQQDSGRRNPPRNGRRQVGMNVPSVHRVDLVQIGFQRRLAQLAVLVAACWPVLEVSRMSLAHLDWRRTWFEHFRMRLAAIPRKPWCYARVTTTAVGLPVCGTKAFEQSSSPLQRRFSRVSKASPAVRVKVSPRLQKKDH